MTKVGFSTTVAEAAKYVELADAAYMRGFIREDASLVLARRHPATKELMPWHDFLLLVRRGEFGYLPWLLL